MAVTWSQGGRPVDMKGSPAPSSFVRELRHALQHLYDPTELRKSPLVALLGAAEQQDPTLGLRSALVEAIRSLKPNPGVPPEANAWRVFHVLSQRYVEQFSQRDIATNLALSTRQLRRLHNLALQALGDYLWAYYDLAERTGAQAAIPPAASRSSPSGSGTATPEQELEWLKRSHPSQAVDVGELIQGVLAVMEPLIRTLAVRVACATAPQLPQVAVQPAALRQALLNALTACAGSVPGGWVHVEAQARDRQVWLDVSALPKDSATAPALPGKYGEKLEVARELLGLCGGSLELIPSEDRRGATVVRLLMPAIEQVLVLVIDDNEDTLQLLERYLAGSRYRFIGVSAPDQALSVATEHSPDVIVLDVMLPGHDGWELLARLREHPRTCGVPVILCTILPQEDLAEALGAAALIRKPVSRAAFLAALDRQLDQRSPVSR